jgi:hypothetical protein
VLHTTDFLARWDGHPYGHWSDNQKHEFLMSLIRIISHHVDYVGAGVFLPSGRAALDHQHATRVAEGKPSLGDNPYELSADTCVGLIAAWLQRTGRTTRRVAYVLEHGDPGQGKFYNSLSGIMQRSQRYCDEYQIASITRAGKGDVPALQTADLLAYEFTHCRADRKEYTPRLRQLASIEIEGFYIDDLFVNRASQRYTETAVADLIREYKLTRQIPKPQKKRRGP